MTSICVQWFPEDYTLCDRQTAASQLAGEGLKNDKTES